MPTLFNKRRQVILGWGKDHRNYLDEQVARAQDRDEQFRLQSTARLNYVVGELTNQKAVLQAQVTTYARTLSAQDDTVRLHLARIEFLQRSLTDATTTTESWAEDRKEALDRIAELEREEKMLRESNDFLRTRCDGLGKALGESRARYGDLEARLAPADAENVGLVQARIRRLIEVLWASRRGLQVDLAEVDEELTKQTSRNVIYTDQAGLRDSMAALGDPIDPVPNHFTVILEELS